MIILVSKSFLLVILTYCTFICAAQNYAVSNIPDGLKTGANAVVRMSNLEFEVLALNKGISKVHYVITILNPNAKELAEVVIGYDKMRSLNSIKATIFDQYGSLVKKLKKNEIRDYSSFDGFSVYSDNRLKYFDLKYSQYPYSIEVEYELHYNGLLAYPSWYIYNSTAMSVENSTYKVIFPTNLGIRYKTHLIDEPNIKEVGINTEYLWSISNLAPIKLEPWSPKFSEINPSVKIAPIEFQLGNYSGNMSTWNGYGQWINKLNENLQTLPNETVLKVKNMTSGLNKKDKVRKIYNYLQQNTRYVSIQLGIGGFQPFEASFVNEKGYGDCKALTNYTMALLNEVGLKSNYTLVNAGVNNSNIDTSFPSHQFNHVILSVPMDKDTIWLECTSQENPFGYLGKFTGDRDVLVINEEGGTIFHTPIYELEDNQQIRVAEILIDQEGDANGKITTIYKGLKSETNGMNFMVEKTYNDKKKWLLNRINIPSFEINSFDYEYNKSMIPSITENLDLNLRNIVSKSSKRMFLNLNLMNKNVYIPPTVKDRKTDVVSRTTYLESDSIIYYIPEGYRPEFQPEDISIESIFGEYKVRVMTNENKVTYIRKLKMNKGRYPANEYSALREFFINIAKADKLSMVLIKYT